MVPSSVISRSLLVAVKSVNQQFQRGVQSSSWPSHEVSFSPSNHQIYSRRSLSTDIPRLRLIRKRGRKIATGETNSSAAAQELHELRLEVKALKQIIREGLTKTNQVESLTRSLADRTSSLESVLGEIKTHVSRINAVEKLLTTARDHIQNNPVLQELRQTFETLLRKSRPYVVKNYKSILATFVFLTIVWKNRSNFFYQRASEDVADLARLALEQESLRQTIQETLYTIASDPQTLQTLNDLFQELIQHERTKQDLVDLIVFATNTPEVQNGLMDLCQLFFQNPKAREMLAVITADVVRDTVDDDLVQQATAIGIQRSFWYAVTPPFLWRYFEKSKPRDVSIDDNKHNDGGDITPAAS